MTVLPSAILLDFDGVIADTERLHLRAFHDVLQGVGIDLRAEEYFGRYLGLDDRAVIERVARDGGVSLGATQVEAMLRDKGARYAAAIAATPVLYEGAEQRIREWSREAPLAIASGSLRSEIEAILGAGRLLACFGAIVTADDVAHGKPAPDGYLLALDLLNAGRRPRIEAGDCAVVEDSLPGLQAARGAGMRAIAVTTNHPASLLSSADLVVPSLAALDRTVLASLF